jgi:hypothetical protein
MLEVLAMQRGVTFGSVVAVITLSLGGCGSNSANRPITAGAAGMSSSGGQAGSSGSAGSGAAGEASGAAGMPGPSGAAGTTGEAGSGTTTGASGTTGAAGSTTVTGTAGSTTMTGAAGTTALSGAAGNGMTSSAAGMGGVRSGPSAGCTAAVPNEPLGRPTTHTMMVTVANAYQPQYVMRKYYTTMPVGYNPDPTKPYPVIFWGPGCGATGPEGSTVSGASYINEILYVQMLSVTGCFQAGKQGTADSPDGPYFDQMLAEVEAHYCIDKAKVFAAGTSSGSWMANFLGCTRGNVIRAIAADSGGLQHDHGTCTGGAAAMEFPGDTTSAVVNGFDIGVGPARDLFIMLNGCSTTPVTMPFGKASNCQFYGNCANPVVFCNTGGSHQAGNSYIPDSAWQFWNTLK